MSTEIINVLNYIGEKLGIAIDWTSENVWPQILDILGRYRIFQIVGLSIWMLVFVILAIVFVNIGKTVVNNYKSCANNTNANAWFYWSTYWGEVKWNVSSCIYLTCLIIYALLSLIFTPIIISEMLEWLFVPEVQYLQILQGYIQ